MSKKYFHQFLMVVLAFLFLFDCSSPTKSKKSSVPIVTINDVWITDAVDNDGDGYNSYFRLNFDLDVNTTDSIDVFVLLGVRVTDPMDTATYYLYLESVDFKIAGASYTDGKYISIGSPNLELPSAAYDFLLEVYFSADPNTRISYSSKTEDPDMGNISIETAQEDVIIYNDIISYNDGSFEDGYYWQTSGYFAVRFSQPSGATSCIIKSIRYHIYNYSANVFIRVWEESGGTPGSYIYYTTTGDEYYLFSNQWNTAYLDIDVSSNDPFFVGYFQYQTGIPILSVDETTPLYGRSYYNSFPTTTWTNDTSGDYAVEVYVEYTTTSMNGKPVVKSEWLTTESY